jgi:catechol 2,3-dioxygenase-like lactoylglutathione lyase family enzyme
MNNLKTSGLRHIALFVTHLEECVQFYTQLLGMKIEWQPDPDNYYLTSGNDNLALHRAKPGQLPEGPQRLDHMGFIIDSMAEVDRWYEFLKEQEVKILMPPKTHRDGARSFYCQDPDGVAVQMIYHPPLVKA